MENLIKKLQEEAGLSEEQALQVMTVIKEYMDDEDIKIDWNKFFKGKYENFKENSKSFFNKVSNQVDDISDKVSDKVEDLTIQAKRSARDFSKKVYDKLNDEDEAKNKHKHDGDVIEVEVEEIDTEDKEDK